ncbi:hypothetical protein [Chondromyces apiculatus]|uniref:Uncharacterized protein n=1 Tax=Chondromyces apiculatus DSM 436 TaxID=1192034 RepID=A0A017T1T0_9BACT|nr:hypothetical protein [Chondromyces apiculatus]EYF02942.1 Hypothetical protein CAP_6365 [Chondromyces apiculatus DSM 436]
MKRHDHELPPLPEDLARGMQALRGMGPTDDLVERALGALPDRRPESARPSSNRERPTSRWLLGSLALAPALAAVGVVAFHLAATRGALGTLPESDPTATLERSEERTLGLDAEGQTWAEFDLVTHHHEGREATVHLEVPESVSVRLPGGDGSFLERSCAESRCLHSFKHSEVDGGPLRVAFAQPGRYEIQVRHESKEARVSERFVVTAIRD